MKAIKTNLAVAELRKIIVQCRNCKIIDSTLLKLLNLYLGLTPYMKQEQVYPIENFYGLSISIGFKNATAMIMAVKQCGAFGIFPESNAYGMSAFYSPLWYEKIDTNNEANKSENRGNFAETFPETFPQNNIYKYISKESSSGEEVSPEGEKLPSSSFSKENFVTTDSLADAKEFFHLINESEEERAKILTPLIDRFQKQEGLSRNHACENLIYLVNELLVPYFPAQPTFRKTIHKDRLVWLSNLLKSAHGVAKTQRKEQGRMYTRFDMLKVRDQELCQTGSVLYARQPCGRYDERELEEQIMREMQGKIMTKDQKPWIDLLSN